MNADAGPSTLPRRQFQPFVSAQHRPEQDDGVFRVVLISTGSVASVKMPDIVGALSRDPSIALQIVATQPSLHFYSQEAIDQAVRFGRSGTGGDVNMNPELATVGIRVWMDADEWSDWKKVGDPILHIELRRWADLVVVAPCSADFLAKLAGGLSENLPLSLLRALSPSTPVILCPAMNTHMYQHPFTAKHLRIVQEELHYLVLGPQGAGKLACGDEGVGKMTDWRDVVDVILNYAAVNRQRPARGMETPASLPDMQSAAIQPRTTPTPVSLAPMSTDNGKQLKPVSVPPGVRPAGPAINRTIILNSVDQPPPQYPVEWPVHGRGGPTLRRQ